VSTPPGHPACPGCERSDGVEQTSAAPRAQAWHCSRCDLNWAISVVNPLPLPAPLADLAAAAEEIDRLRWALGQVITLTDQAPGLTDAQLRERLLALADHMRGGERS
jgi:transposase-like protein